MKILCLLLISLTASADHVSDYSYSLSSPLKSTVAAAKIVPPASAVNTSIKVRIFDRKNSRSRRDLKVRLYPSNGRKLVFLLAGLGGNGETPLAQFLAAHIQSNGFSAVIIPNTMTSDFVLGASTTGMVGHVVADSRDTYSAIEATVATLREQGRSENEFAVIGYSMGALIAARVQEMDTLEKRIGFQSTLLINPPVSLLYGMRTLDAYYDQFRSMGLGSKMGLASKIKKFLEFIGIAPAQADSHEVAERDLQAAIGYSMRVGFSDMILATQDIRDLEILPLAETDRGSAAKRIGYEKYVGEFLIPALNHDGRTYSLDSLNAETSLTAQEQYLTGAQNVFALHNSNDFLMSAAELEWIEATFRHRARIYPRGGHMGNLAHEDNLQAIGNWLHNRPIN